MRLLLDAQISPRVAIELRKLGIDVEALEHWHGGTLRHAVDEQILIAALTERRDLVTYDLKTVPSLIKEWSAKGSTHSDGILVDERTVAGHDLGGLVRALSALVSELGGDDLTNVVRFLTPAG